ncbi:hypothetical protein ZOSMA_48G00030 [Zostera marina]|uniref:Uncharacterized protein n=1 Tax=Zostera marina TaxID=29655 RepID=A0A0K9NZD7_ZOSMR|nr:hypothetical protein ZOSMA_48G00030 [Zostera marina]
MATGRRGPVGRGDRVIERTMNNVPRLRFAQKFKLRLK